MGTWKIDPDHAVVFFAVKHFMITDVRGQINQVTGRVVFDEEALLSTTIDLEIGAGAIFTGVKKRDEHLRSSDFLDAAKYPTIQFQGRAVELTAVRSFKMKGNLTLRGITRGMILDVDCVGPVRVPEELGGETCMSFVLSGRLRQEDFGIIWNVPMENNGLLVGREIRLWVNLEADLETPVEQT